jgi:hypothetical protein
MGLEFGPRFTNAFKNTKSLVRATDEPSRFDMKQYVEPDPENIERSTILPVIKNKDTGNMALGLPGAIKDTLVGLGTYDKILKGEVDVDSPEAAKTAFDLALGTAGAGLASSSTLKATRPSPGTTGMFMGAKSQTFNPADAVRAEELGSLGYSAREIWETTQNRIWNSGIRQEIDDSVMKVKDPQFKTASWGAQYTRLNELIDHPELFKAYPDLKDAFIVIDDSFKDGRASYQRFRDADIISIGADKKGNADTQSLLHEIQHAIQNKEGWQGGGSPDEFKGRSIILPNGEVKTVDNFMEYQTLAGEWEARITQNRDKLTPEERKNVFPDDGDIFPSSALNVHTPKYQIPSTINEEIKKPKGNSAVIPAVGLATYLSGDTKKDSNLKEKQDKSTKSKKEIILDILDKPKDVVKSFNIDKIFSKLIQAESGGKQTDSSGKLLTSSKGAEGITQVMPKTQKNPGYGVTPAKDKSQKELLRVGKDYLKAMYEKFGDPELAVAAYNAGPVNVQRAIDKAKQTGKNWKDHLPKRSETLPYIDKILGTKYSKEIDNNFKNKPVSKEK